MSRAYWVALFQKWVVAVIAWPIEQWERWRYPPDVEP